MMNIVLVGFMGTGKTAVAKALARRTGMRYVSLDSMIEEKEKRTIGDIFAGEGEAYFRKVEKDMVREASERDGQVIDAGGGVVLDRDNMDMLSRNGTVICLWASAETIRERTRHATHRPLLEVEDPMEKITALLEERRPFYEKAGQRVDTDGLDVEAVAERIMEITGQ